MPLSNIRIHIPEDEFIVKASRSSGPGGQSVNKLNTKITLFFNLAESGYLTDIQKRTILQKLSGRITSDGNIIISSQHSRSQLSNRIDATAKLNLLLSNALKPARPRRPTHPSRGSIERRLSAKRRRSHLKRLRSSDGCD